MSLSTLIKNLQNAELYPHAIHYFKIIETHISVIILTGDFAYKIKKPLDLNFLNFETLAQRHYYCQAELQLNQRTAPDIYVDVIAITGDVENPQLNGAGEIIEYAIKMREFPQTALFSELLNNHQLTPELIDATAKMLAKFHAYCDIQIPDAALGSPENINQFVIQNFEQIRPLLNDASDLSLLNAMRHWAEQQYQALYPIFQQRKLNGYIRACHGDVHLQNIMLWQDKPSLFDCIEFNPALQWTDTMADLGFLSMDLIDKGRSDYAQQLVNTYMECSGDYEGLAVLNYYQHYRTMVRAKITLFYLLTPQLNAVQQSETLQIYRQKMQLAAAYTETQQNFLAITYGVSGTGKSTLTKKIVAHVKAIQLRSDIERKRFAGANLSNRGLHEVDTGLYTPEMTQKTYQHLLELAERILLCGYSVIVDATFLKLAQRQAFLALAKKLNLAFVILACSAPDEILQQRIHQRIAEAKDISDASVKVLAMQSDRIESLTTEEIVNTINCSNKKINQIIDRLKKQIHLV